MQASIDAPDGQWKAGVSGNCHEIGPERNPLRGIRSFSCYRFLPRTRKKASNLRIEMVVLKNCSVQHPKVIIYDNQHGYVFIWSLTKEGNSAQSSRGRQKAPHLWIEVRSGRLPFSHGGKEGDLGKGPARASSGQAAGIRDRLSGYQERGWTLGLTEYFGPSYGPRGRTRATGFRSR